MSTNCVPSHHGQSLNHLVSLFLWASTSLIERIVALRPRSSALAKVQLFAFCNLIGGDQPSHRDGNVKDSGRGFH